MVLPSTLAITTTGQCTSSTLLAYLNLNQVMLDLILEKIEDEEDYKLAVEAYEEYKLNKEKAISFEDLVKKMGLENEI